MKTKKAISLLCAVLMAVSMLVCTAAAPCGLVTAASAETISNPKNGEIIRDGDSLDCGQEGLYFSCNGKISVYKGVLGLHIDEWDSSKWCTGWKIDGGWVYLPKEGRQPDGVRLAGEGTESNPFAIEAYYNGQYQINIKNTLAHAETSDGKTINTSDEGRTVYLVFDENNNDGAVFVKWVISDASVEVDKADSPKTFFTMPGHDVTINVFCEYNLFEDDDETDPDDYEDDEETDSDSDSNSNSNDDDYYYDDGENSNDVIFHLYFDGEDGTYHDTALGCTDYVIPTYSQCRFKLPEGKVFKAWELYEGGYESEYSDYGGYKSEHDDGLFYPGDFIYMDEIYMKSKQYFRAVWKDEEDETDTETDTKNDTDVETGDEPEEAKITLNKTEAEVFVGETLKLKYTITPESAKSVPVSWYSDDEDIAVVSDGTVKGLKAGTAVISAIMENGLFAECVVDVKDKETQQGKTEVTLNMTEAELIVGKKLVLTPTVTPESAKSQKILWYTDEEGVVDVLGGTVIARSPGVVVITAITEDGAFAECTVTVKPKHGSETDSDKEPAADTDSEASPDVPSDTESDKSSDTATDKDSDTAPDNGKKDTEDKTDKPDDPDKPNRPYDPDVSDKSKVTGIFGDVDGDGQITANDALMTLRSSIGLETLTAVQKKLADVDGDGQLTSADALEILRFSIGLSKSEKIGKPIEV